MEMAYIKQYLGRKGKLLILIVFVLCSCGERKTSFGTMQLNEFVTSKDLDSTIDYVVSHLREGYTSDLVLELMKSDTLLSIEISLQERKYISKYIYYNNRRVVGFTRRDNDTIIILSNIDNLYDLGASFCNYLQPIECKGDVHYLQIPLSQYEIRNRNKKDSADIFTNRNNWADIPYMYEPSVFTFLIKNNRITYPPNLSRR